MPPLSFSDDFTLAPDAQAIATRLLQGLDHFEQVSHARPLLLFSVPPLRLHGAGAWAIIGVCRVQGPWRDLFRWSVDGFARSVFGGELAPDFLVLVDRPHFQALSPIEQERLVYHELCHITTIEDPETGCPKLDDETGLPRLALRPHDVEVFEAEAARYGPELCNLHGLGQALVEFAERPGRRTA